MLLRQDGGAYTTLQKVKPLRGTKVVKWLYPSDEVGVNRIPGAVIRNVGKGHLACIPMNMGERYINAKTTVARDFLNSIVRMLMPNPRVEVQGSHKISISFMRKDNTYYLHLINNGGEHQLDCYTFDEIPPIGPLEISIEMERLPKIVKLQPGNRRIKWAYRDEKLCLRIPKVELHDIIEIHPE